MPHPSSPAPFVLTLSLLAACAATGDEQHSIRVVEADDAVRAPLLDAVKALEGRWHVAGDAGAGTTVFEVTSNGSAVRETMFAGEEHEMTNMYTLDGNGLHMTHYCAMGNQPHMRATAVENGRIEFHPAGVSDLEAADETYMGQMTLVIVDADHIEQHWKGFGAEPHETVISLERESGARGR